MLVWVGTAESYILSIHTQVAASDSLVYQSNFVSFSPSKIRQRAICNSLFSIRAFIA
jgi:hypothetical protein